MTTLRSVTLAVTGGIAAYKCCELVRCLKKAGIDVHVAMTAHAAAFVGPVTFEALTGHPVALTEWAPGPQGSMPHIELNRACDLLIVMPATANIIAKAAHGIADDLVSTLIAARRQPVLFVPAMNRFMWENPANLRNVERLRRDGAHFAGPACGLQACGDVGAGRMSEPAEVLDLLCGLLSPKTLEGRRVLVTAGPTFEPIDDVRGITNRSSGLQGFEVARAARDAGAQVTLVCGPVHLPTPFGVTRIDVTTASEMLAAVEGALEPDGADVFVGVAAVADWRIANAVNGKMKKAAGQLPELRLEENPDILRTVGARSDVGLKVGFAAEAENLEAYARSKCIAKHADLIVGNLARSAIGSPDNSVLFVTPDGAQAYGPASKRDVAREIVSRIASMLNPLSSSLQNHAD